MRSFRIFTSVLFLALSSFSLLALDKEPVMPRFEPLSVLRLELDQDNPLYFDASNDAYAKQAIGDDVYFSNFHASLNLRNRRTAPIIELIPDSELFLTENVSSPLVVSLISYERDEVQNRILQLSGPTNISIDEFENFDKLELLSGLSFHANLLSRNGRKSQLQVLEPMDSYEIQEMIQPNATKATNPYYCDLTQYGTQSMNLVLSGAVCYATRYCDLVATSAHFTSEWRAAYAIHYPLRGQIWPKSDDSRVSFNGTDLLLDIPVSNINPTRPGPHYLRHAWMNLDGLFNNRGGYGVVYRIDSCADGTCTGSPDLSHQGGPAISIGVMIDHVVATFNFRARDWGTTH